jgi:hypothetical protein
MRSETQLTARLPQRILKNIDKASPGVAPF